MKDKKGFTLAEVLITLAIIGIIAAITIPSIVANHQKRELETRFAKAYRTLSQVVNLAIAEHGAIDTWSDVPSRDSDPKDKDDFMKKYFLPHLNITKYCPADNSISGCFPNETYKYMHGGYASAENIFERKFPKFILADGMLVTLKIHHTDAYTRPYSFYIDTNGHKKPNTIGKDYFCFSFYPETNEFLPYGVYKDEKINNTLTKNTKDEINADCQANSTGWLCGIKIVQDGFKMNY